MWANSRHAAIFFSFAVKYCSALNTKSQITGNLACLHCREKALLYTIPMWEAVLIWLFVLQIFCSLQSITMIPFHRYLRPEERVLCPLSLISCSLKFTPRSLHSAQWLVAGLKCLSCNSQRGSSFTSWVGSWLFSDFSQGEKISVPSEPNVTFFLFSCRMKNWKIFLFSPETFHSSSKCSEYQWESQKKGLC